MISHGYELRDICDRVRTFSAFDRRKGWWPKVRGHILSRLKGRQNTRGDGERERRLSELFARLQKSESRTLTKFTLPSQCQEKWGCFLLVSAFLWCVRPRGRRPLQSEGPDPGGSRRKGPKTASLRSPGIRRLTEWLSLQLSQ